MKLQHLVVIMLIFSACDTEKQKIENRIDEQKDLTIKHTHAIYQTYTKYLTADNYQEFERAGIELLQELKHLDTIDYDFNPSGLFTFYTFDSTQYGLSEVKFQTAEYGVGWSIPIDSFLNAKNRELKILVHDEMFSKK